jgi:hypothetical protein
MKNHIFSPKYDSGRTKDSAAGMQSLYRKMCFSISNIYFFNLSLIDNLATPEPQEAVFFEEHCSRF